MKIIMPIGISGSGKTRLYHKRYEGMTLVSPDNLRKKISGDISNQKCNKEVFKRVLNMVDDLVERDVDFYYDATNCNTEYRKRFSDRFKGNPNVEVIYVVLPCDPQVCFDRVKTDIKNKVDRPNVPSDVVIRQYGMYSHSLKLNFEGENVQEIIYLKPEDLV